MVYNIKILAYSQVVFAILFLATLVGISLGLLGAGGSVLALPILRYAAHLPTAVAVPMSLATVGAVSLVGVLSAGLQGRVRWKEGLTFALIGSLGTLVGVGLAGLLAEWLQMLAFLLVVLVTALRMLRPPRGGEPAAEGPSFGWAGLLLRALSVGMLTGVVGVGGGFLIVPALVLLFGFSIREATATSLLVIAFNSGVGLAAYSRVVELDWGLGVRFTAAALVGLFLGQALARKLPAAGLQRLFGLLLLAVGAMIVVQEFL